ncbi:MAG: peptide deformylase [Candidatus Omnitrophica bacterium]|nr:peptide deformylase [Candidatus Omnitrophota bacterium]
MAILKVSRLGNPVLRKATEAIPKEAITSPEIQRLIADMVDTMREYEGVGIAAPQVHVSRQLAVIEVNEPPGRGEKRIPLTVLINPRITASAKQLAEDWEGCLSVNDLRGKVPRTQWVDVEAFNQKGERVKFHAEGFFARVIQHECDHLAGKVFLDRMPNLLTLSHLQELARYGCE